MKRIIIILAAMILLFGCAKTDLNERSNEHEKSYENENSEVLSEEIKGIWLAIYEIAPESKSEEDYILKVEKIMNNISSFGLTDVFVQVRANCDAIYLSEIFPPCYMYASDGKLWFDALSILCEKAHEYKLNIHAWINPYRVCSDYETQPVNIPEGLNKNELLTFHKGKYLCPSDIKTTEIISLGVKEIIENYDIDGIHFDDYFYPSSDKSIDKKAYSKYLNDGGSVSLEDFRRNSVSSMISSVYNVIKEYDESLIFSISPCADIEKNENELFADVEKWCSNEGYCDIIIPQIYFGFENLKMPFKETLYKWAELSCKSKIKLCVGLSAYKIGQEDIYAGESGKVEWVENSDILKREIEFIRNTNADGFLFFSYNYIFGNRNFTKEEIKNVKDVI